MVAVVPETATVVERRKAVIAAVVGNALEWYDFGVYGYFVLIISQLFFPAEDPLVSRILTFAVFGIGFVMRPAGSIIFGIYSDRAGRRKSLGAVIFLMAFSTFAIGLLPTYSQVGPAAPILLVCIRLLQGLSAGGEGGSSSTYLVEYAPKGQRGFIGSFQQATVGAGFLLGSLSAAILAQLLSHDEMTAWGWRIPFLLGGVYGVFGAYLRWRLSDTPKFTEIEEQGDTSSRPFLEAITKYPTETLTVFGLTLHFTVAYYIVIVFLPQHIVSVAGLTPANAQWISVSSLVVFVVIIPLWGALSDKIGRKIFLQVSTLGYVLLAYPLFMMATSGSSTLALIAQLTFVVILSAFAGPAPATFSEMFPTRVRCTAQSIGNNLAVAIFGGFAPLISTSLIKITGDNLAPSYYLMAAAAVSFLVSLRLTETAFSELK
jgi:MHS family proline/betaine transporter-like MFS transporter